MHTLRRARQRAADGAAPMGNEWRIMATTRPFGSWPSPIGSADLVRGALRLSSPRIADGFVYWLEGRPAEGGRQVVMRARLPRPGASIGADLSALGEVSPAGVNVRTRVHEYGGGEFSVWRDRVFYVDDADGRIRAVAGHGSTASDGGLVRSPSPPGTRYADLVVSPDGRWLFAIEERAREAREVENRLVVFALDPARPIEAQAVSSPRVVAAGHDFYASPIVSPRSDRVAWLAWDHPHMPWNETRLESVDWCGQGAASGIRTRLAHPGEALFQPRFSAEGELFVVSDRSGWWRLAHVGEGGLRTIGREAAELGRAQWVFGQSTWAFLDGRHVLASATREGLDSLVRIDLERGDIVELTTPFRMLGGLEIGEGFVACLAGTVASAASLYLGRVAEIGHGGLARVRASASFEIPDTQISRGEARIFDSADGRRTHAFVYLPRSAEYTGPAGTRPPLLVKSHGGPTAATSAALDPRIQFWTSRGFAVADVNYAGSTGYGRAYRDLLEGMWGVFDVEDCVAVARVLAADGSVDGERRAISGGSAGGYTTLCALTFHDAFSAGASHYGIGDLETLARDTHKFESRYTDWLVGPLPESRDRYVARSPVHHPERLACPTIFFQGLEDRVVPPNQAEAMVAVLARRGIAHAYVPFEGEQHGFRRAENIRTALDGELYFYSRAFGFEAPRPAGIRVENAHAT